MKLDRIDDPRDSLDKAHRLELVRFANANGMKEINENMPAILIRRELRKKGLTNIRIPKRPLGAQNPPPAENSENVVQASADDDLARQYSQPQPSHRRYRRLVERPKLEINILRDKCKSLGIKMERRDGTNSLKAKIEAYEKGREAGEPDRE